MEYGKQLGLLADVRTDLREAEAEIERNSQLLRDARPEADRDMPNPIVTFIEGLALVLGDTPRRVKRFVNVVQVLYAMSQTLSTAIRLSDRGVVALHASLCGGAPRIARRLATVGANQETIFRICWDRERPRTPGNRRRSRRWLALRSGPDVIC